MKIRTWLGFAALIALAGAGCSGSTTTGGTVGGATFKLNPPTTGGPTIEQGETANVDFSITRNDGFTDDVAVSAETSAKGVTVKVEPATVKSSDKAEFKVAVTAAADAATGDHKIMVKGKPSKGTKEAAAEFTVTVKAKK